MKYDFRNPNYLYNTKNNLIASTEEECILKNKCPHCNEENEILLNKKDYILWKGSKDGPKKLVQEVFRWLRPDQTEILITGIHLKCWDQIFKKPR